MRLVDWCQREGRGAISRLSQVTGIAYSTVHQAVHGQAIKLYEVAKKLSEATAGEVTVEELCEPQPVDPKSHGDAA